MSRSTPAVNYLHLSGPTTINFEGTPLMSTGRGATTVESECGVIRVSAELENFVLPREIFWQVIESERKDTPSLIHGAVRDAKYKLRPGELAVMGAKEAAGG